MTTLISILIIYLTIGGFIALVIAASEYKVPFWNAVGVGLIYPYLILVGIFNLIRLFIYKNG